MGLQAPKALRILAVAAFAFGFATSSMATKHEAADQAPAR